MSTSAFSSNENVNKNPNLLATDSAEKRQEKQSALSSQHSAQRSQNQEESYADMKFVLDEPWRVKILPKQEPEKLPPGVLPKPEPFNPRQQPWRPGDVTRLKEDTPEGMMKYIATHTTGWWQEMAQRALRDTERAQRRAEEAGVQYGQYWTLELDVETKEKLRLKEEARRARAEAERAKEDAAKEAFAQRQRELLEKAGRAPRCEYRYTDGRGCRAPQVRGERWCHGHAKMMSYRPERLELVPMEDEQSVAVNLYRVTKSLASGRITEKMAGLMLWSVAIGASGSRVIARDRRNRRDRENQEQQISPQRKADKNWPQMNAERRRSEEGVSREGTRMDTHAEKQSALSTQHSVRKSKTCNSGVTEDNSFVSGVGHRSTRPVSQTSAAEAGDRPLFNRRPEGLLHPNLKPEGPFDSAQGGALLHPKHEGTGLMDIHQAGVAEKHQHQAVDQRHLGKRLKIKEAGDERGWHEGCNSLGKGKASRDAADLDPSFGASALIQDDGV